MAAAKDTATPKPSANGSAKREVTFEERAAMNTAPAWRPVEGDTLRGELVGTRVGRTTDYPDYPVLILAREGGEPGEYIAFHAFHGVAVDRLTELKPKRGDVLTIKYLGAKVTNATKDKPEKDQTLYHLYYIERDGDTAGVSEEFNFDS
jgi:hypothetical protein